MKTAIQFILKLLGLKSEKNTHQGGVQNLNYMSRAKTNPRPVEEKEREEAVLLIKALGVILKEEGKRVGLDVEIKIGRMKNDEE
ncbi:hypothetical protein [Litoribacter populi]|uniref:hypothetical protein n=1 Tax=Litoribacter populi TaxID=2598460 RepID=UPI00117DA0FB|nr:hypothetical protein [Litoribacter populi]